MSKALLDTHTVIWAIYSSGRLGCAAAEMIANKDNTVLVSAASAWEVATKIRIGKMPEAAWLERDFLEAVDDAGFELIPMSVDQALRAGRLIGTHRDPFDRMIAAQALAMDIPVISIDAKLDTFGIRRIW